MKQISRIIVVMIAWTFSAVIWADSPVPMLENAASQILTTLKQNKAQLKNNHQIIHQAVERSLVPIVDVNGMSRSVLGREAWSKASVADKQEFTKEFTQLVIRTYARPLAEYSDETVKFLPVHAATQGRFMRVNSLIVRSNGPNIPLSYSLVSTNGHWKIYDLSVEGVSLLQSFSSQFKQALHNSSMKALIADMRQNKKVA